MIIEMVDPDFLNRVMTQYEAGDKIEFISRYSGSGSNCMDWFREGRRGMELSKIEKCRHISQNWKTPLAVIRNWQTIARRSSSATGAEPNYARNIVAFSWGSEFLVPLEHIDLNARGMPWCYVRATAKAQ